jgi:hypothetical protein
MKKVRVILASAACMVAVAGVFANKSKTVLLTYFVPSYANRAQTSGVFCTVVVSSSCSGSGVRCTKAIAYPGTGDETVYHPIVSQMVQKTVNNVLVTVCTAVFKP